MQIALGGQVRGIVRNEGSRPAPCPSTRDQHGGRTCPGRDERALAVQIRDREIPPVRHQQARVQGRQRQVGHRRVPEGVPAGHHPRGAPAHRQGAADRGLGQQPGQLQREEVRVADLGPGEEDHQEGPDSRRPVLHGAHPTRQRQHPHRGRHQEVREAEGRRQEGRRPHDRPQREPDKPITLPAGTKFTGKANGKTFVSTDSVADPRATKVFDKKTGKFLRNNPGYAGSSSRRRRRAPSTRPAPRTTTASRA
jgi:hypothetical protein